MKVVLVELNPDQIEKSKEINGSGKKITHAVICGRYGQIFGTEKQCREYYSAWSGMFPELFEGGEEKKDFEPSNYESTFDLVNILIAENDKRQR